MSIIDKYIPKVLGHNLESTPKEVIVDQLNEPRPLPMGRKEFEEWSDRIIAGAVIPGGEDDKEAFIESQKFALAGLIMHLGPTESHKPDAFFIHSLRKLCCNQVAHAIGEELRKKGKERSAAKEAEEKAKKAFDQMGKQKIFLAPKGEEDEGINPDSPAL